MCSDFYSSILLVMSFIALWENSWTSSWPILWCSWVLPSNSKLSKPDGFVDDVVTLLHRRYCLFLGYQNIIILSLLYFADFLMSQLNRRTMVVQGGSGAGCIEQQPLHTMLATEEEKACTKYHHTPHAGQNVHYQWFFGETHLKDPTPNIWVTKEIASIGPS